MKEVSPCCGTSYEDSWISDCCTMELSSDSDICPACKEHTDASGHICNECENWFETPESGSDWHDRMEENAMEEKASASRKYGE